MSETKDITVWDKLRAPFPKEVMGLLPKPYKKDSPKGSCKECGGYHGLPAVHLDFVGHAAVTDRLLSVDPGWTWEPLAYTEAGLPAYDDVGGLWIKLTVNNVTRLGYGDGSNSSKELIGDAIRNAAMRFGVALDLWSKEELESTLADPTLKNEKPSAKQAPVTRPEAPQPTVTSRPGMITPKQLQKCAILFKEADITERADKQDYIEVAIGRRVESSTELTSAEGIKLIDALIEEVNAINEEN